MNKLDTTKNGFVTGKALPAKDGYTLTPSAGMVFNLHNGNAIIATRVAIINAYKAQGMSDAQAVAKFNELNQDF